MARAARVILGALEKRQQRVVIPAARAGSNPIGIVLALAANIDQAIDR